MADRTRAELVRQALANLGVSQSGNPPSDEDVEDVDAYVPGTLAMLEAKGIITVNENDIPPEVFLPIAVLLANDAALEFGVAIDERAIAKAERDIRIMMRSGPTREAQTTEYF